MRSTSSLIPLLLVLASCGSPPRPPTVDESSKRPANSAMAVELQACKSELQNTRILATESNRIAESAAVTLARVSTQQQANAAAQGAALAASAANRVFTIHFGVGSARVVVPADMASILVEAARAAPLVLLRGRTDGATDSAAESRLARKRAAAVQDYLVAAGIDPAHIRATYQPAGDHAADNLKPAGRGLNRRVEVEVYGALPVAVGTLAVAAP